MATGGCRELGSAGDGAASKVRPSSLLPPSILSHLPVARYTKHFTILTTHAKQQQMSSDVIAARLAAEVARQRKRRGATPELAAPLTALVPAGRPPVDSPQLPRAREVDEKEVEANSGFEADGIPSAAQLLSLKMRGVELVPAWARKLSVSGVGATAPVLTLEQCWHTVCQHCSREVLARANSTSGQVLAHGVLTAGSRGVRTHW